MAAKAKHPAASQWRYGGPSRPTSASNATLSADHARPQRPRVRRIRERPSVGTGTLLGKNTVLKISFPEYERNIWKVKKESRNAPVW